MRLRGGCTYAVTVCFCFLCPPFSLHPPLLPLLPLLPPPRFCDHNDFGGVGMALAPRIHLFRANLLRSVGSYEYFSYEYFGWSYE